MIFLSLFLVLIGFSLLNFENSSMGLRMVKNDFWQLFLSDSIP